ncbi:NnrS family protein [Ideonella sp.]|uniref:NnrS family protein n=1 Tax=Ideonella sp. TaxID=1929293 RepID=UPI003BB5262F
MAPSAMTKPMPSIPLLATDAPQSVAPPLASAQFPLPGWPLFRLGFRPFYLGAAAFALFAVPYWIAGLLGLVALPSTMSPILWHAHEMLYGFAVAVIVGFLLTAGKAWTGLATPRGATLAAMAGLWLAARLSAVAAPYAIYAVLDLVLLPWVALVLIRVMLKAGNRRNLPLGAILLLLAAANLGFHAAALGWLNIDPLRALYAGLALVVMIECVIAGRVIPAFTMSALPGRQLKVPLWLEHSTLATTALSMASWVLLPANSVTAAGFALAGLLHAARLWHWQPLRTRLRPILWVLHAAYAWLPVGFLLMAWAQLGGVAASAGIHALAVGATAGLIVGMVTRTARGHTGRPLKVSRREVAAYLLVTVAAIARVLLPLVAPAHTADWLVLAAAAWATAFALYLWVFTPWLLSSRLDGKDG